MATLKTRPTDANVEAFIAAVEPARRREDAMALKPLMDRVTGLPAVMWGASIVGYGRYAYTTGSGWSGEYFLTGFSPRKQATTVYVMPGFTPFEDLMTRLGKHRTAKSCLYISRLDDIDLAVLAELIRRSLAWMRERYPDSD